MRRADQLLKTMTALRSCLETCREDATPLAALDKCLSRLRQDPDWTEAEIAEVETAARRAIQSDSFCLSKSAGAKSTTMFAGRM